MHILFAWFEINKVGLLHDPQNLQGFRLENS